MYLPTIRQPFHRIAVENKHAEWTAHVVFWVSMDASLTIA